MSAYNDNLELQCRESWKDGYDQGMEDGLRDLLIWLMRKEYLNEVIVDRDEDFDGNWTYETVVNYLDVDEVLEEYLKEKVDCGD